jgi:hypothetical protein
LRPSFNSLCDVEELVGKPFIEIAAAATTGSVTAIRQLVWAYLQERHRDEIATLRDAGLWIERAGGLDRVQAAMQQLVELNNSGTGNGSDPPLAQAGTGASSTSRPDGSA